MGYHFLSEEAGVEAVGCGVDLVVSVFAEGFCEVLGGCEVAVDDEDTHHTHLEVLCGDVVGLHEAYQFGGWDPAIS